MHPQEVDTLNQDFKIKREMLVWQLFGQLNDRVEG